MQVRMLWDPPDQDCMEWSLLGKEKPESLYKRFSQWEETSTAFQSYEPHTSVMFLKSADERPVAGNYLYMVRYFDVMLGYEAVSYMAEQLNLTILQLLVFLKGHYPPQYVVQRGYKFKQSTGVCSLYTKEINLFLTPHGLYLHAREKHSKQWEHISRVVKQEVSQFRPIVERKWA